jgi:hypothetical protein
MLSIQTKVTMLLCGTLFLLASNIGSYFYGHSVGVDAQKGKQAAVEVARVNKVADTAIKQAGSVVAGVEQDNKKESEANGKYEAAMAELRAERSNNRRLIADNRGLRIDASICSRRDGVAGQAETTGTGQGDGAITGTVALPQELAERLQHRADEADIILERMRTLRDWVISQGFSPAETIPDGPEVELNY